MSDVRIRYSKVSRRMWNDEDFRALSPAPPNAQTLWQRLITGPELSNIPGLFAAREGGLADALGWSLKAFREKWKEIEAKGMAKADWKAGLVWLPNAPKHNKPESPNVVVSWDSMWDELPECPLKWEARVQLEAFAEGLGEAFAKAFAKACPKASGVTSPVTSGVTSPNQEQEQEQEQKGLGGGFAKTPAREPPDTPPGTLTSPPDVFEVDEAMRTRCAMAGTPEPDADHVAACFANARAKGLQRADWGEEFFRWMLREKTMRVSGTLRVRAPVQQASGPRTPVQRPPAPADDELTPLTKSLARAK